MKLLDPSFLNDAEHENLRSISIVDNSDLKLNNCHVPQKIMRLLPLERSEIKTHKSFHHNSSLKLSEIRKINNDNTSSMMSENKNVLEENSNITSILKNPLKNQELHTMFLIIFFYIGMEYLFNISHKNLKIINNVDLLKKGICLCF